MSAVVTGHSRGLGAAIAEELLRRDIPVLGISRKPNRDLSQRFPALRETQLNLASESAVERWVSSGALADWLEGRTTAYLINNAGLLQPVGPLEDQDPAAVARAVAVNLGAALALSAAFVQATTGATDRRILHVSSGAARHAYAGWSVYCATKAALDHHARAVALDHTPALRIVSLAPGVLDTDMQAEVRDSSPSAFPDVQRFLDLKHEGKLKSPATAATQAVEYLLSADYGVEPVAELPRTA
jgi:NAD(P)-dependent dehydrogenase (short-subunit alcohol dehydrogenase family)